MAKIYTNFEFVGKLNIPKDEYFHKVIDNGKGWQGHVVKFVVNESPNNGVFVELMGGYKPKDKYPIKTSPKLKYDNEGNKIEQSTLEIPFDSRLDDNVVRMVADFRKIVVDTTTDFEAKNEAAKVRYDIRNIEQKQEITEEESKQLEELYKKHNELVPNRKEFLHDFDAAQYLVDVLPENKTHTYKVTGNVEFSEYNGKIQKRFKIQTIEIVPEDEKHQLKMIADLFFKKGAVDDSVQESGKKVLIDTYALQYDNKTKKDQYFPLPLVLNLSKVDFNNERQMKLVELLKKQLTVTSNKEVYHLLYELKVVRGAEEVEFDESKLTVQQREFIELGVSKLEDYKPKGSVYGEAVEEIQLIKPLLKEVSGNNFTSGALLSDVDVDDLGYKPLEPVGDIGEEVLTDDEEDTPKKEVEMNSLDDELAGLFG